MKTFKIITSLVLLTFCTSVLTQDIAPATVEDLEAFDRQLFESKPIEQNKRKESKSVEKIAKKEAKKLEKELKKQDKSLAKEKKLVERQSRNSNNSGKGNGRDDAQREHSKKGRKKDKK